MEEDASLLCGMCTASEEQGDLPLSRSTLFRSLTLSTAPLPPLMRAAVSRAAGGVDAPAPRAPRCSAPSPPAPPTLSTAHLASTGAAAVCPCARPPPPSPAFAVARTHSTSTASPPTSPPPPVPTRVRSAPPRRPRGARVRNQREHQALPLQRGSARRAEMRGRWLETAPRR
eukprot:1393831-Rhodomonas_salina.4